MFVPSCFSILLSHKKNHQADNNQSSYWWRNSYSNDFNCFQTRVRRSWHLCSQKPEDIEQYLKTENSKSACCQTSDLLPDLYSTRPHTAPWFSLSMFLSWTVITDRVHTRLAWEMCTALNENPKWTKLKHIWIFKACFMKNIHSLTQIYVPVSRWNAPALRQLQTQSLTDPNLFYPLFLSTVHVRVHVREKNCQHWTDPVHGRAGYRGALVTICHVVCSSFTGNFCWRCQVIHQAILWAMVRACHFEISKKNRSK